MARNDPVEQNIIGVNQLVNSKINKLMDGAANQQEGVSDSVFEDDLTLKLDDAELLRLAKTIENKYAAYEAKIKIRQQENKKYYEGKQMEGSSLATSNQPISANLIFEAVETFLPAALSKEPDPVVWCDNTQVGNARASSVKTMLQYHVVNLSFRRKLQLMTRKWTMDLMGVMKYGWDKDINDICLEVRDAKRFIFDADGYVDVYGDFIGLLGERIDVTAQKLADMFPKFKAFITAMVDGKMGTTVTYTEWWNDDFTFCTFKGKVLDKSKNPNFNYDHTEVDEATGEEITTEAKNHFAKPKKPYVFLSVFSTGNQPHDDTGLIEQNIPNQRRVSRRTEQIDTNLSKGNNSELFSMANFQEETAKQASTAIIKGHPVLVPPGGPLREAIVRLPAPGIDASYFNELENSKNDLRSIFGTQGITSQTPSEQKGQTARGQILNTQYDTSRIGGGIGDALEQVAKNVFNAFVQLYKVYYDEAHFAAVLGKMKAVEYVVLSAQTIGDAHLVVSISPDSMKPKDEITESNQALALWEAKALDIKTLLTVLNFPDAQTTAAQVWLFQTNPALYGQLNFPELSQEIQALVAQQNPPAPGTPNGAGQVAPQAPPSTGEPAPNPSLSQVPLPH